MTWSKPWTLALLPLCLAGCQQSWPGGRPTAPAAEAKVIGEAQSCIPIDQIRETRIRDDMTIDFIGNGNQVWRVSLDAPCPSLKSQDKFSYDTSLSQLCSTDIIHVLHEYGGRIQRGAACGLNRFTPVELLQ